MNAEMDPVDVAEQAGLRVDELVDVLAEGRIDAEKLSQARATLRTGFVQLAEAVRDGV